MKRIIALLLALATLASLAGCGEVAQPDVTIPSPTTTQATVDTRPDAANLLISEVMPDNKFLAMGHENDWVELYNGSTEPVNLADYYLSDSLEQRFRYRMPQMILEPDSYVVIFCDDKNYIGENGEIHANFGLSNGDKLCLTGKDGSYSVLPVQFPGDDVSVSFHADGSYQASSVSLGYPNDEDGVANYIVKNILI